MKPLNQYLLAAGLLLASHSLAQANGPFLHRHYGYGMMPAPMMMMPAPMPMGIGMMGVPSSFLMGGSFSMSMPATINLNMTMNPGLNFGLGNGLFNNQQFLSSADMLLMFATRFAASPAGNALLSGVDPETRKLLEGLAATAKQLDTRVGRMEDLMNRALNSPGTITPEMIQRMTPAERNNLAGRLEAALKLLQGKDGN